MNFALPTTTLAALAISALSAVAQDYQTGMSELKINDDTGTRHITGVVWYPTDTSSKPVRAHGNAVWEPIKVHPNAQPIDGAHPLVVLSHGMYGNHRNQAWLASILTQQGYIVAAIDHPGTSTFQRDSDHARELWKRPQDISRTIDHLLDTPIKGLSVDADKIFMAGHSLGGFTAVALAGGRFEPTKFDAFCASQTADIACGVINSWNVAQSQEDRISMSQDLSDSRIKGFAVFDLGGTQSFSTNSLQAIETPMLVYGAPVGSNGLNLDVESRALVAALPKQSVQYHEPKDYAHFDFLGRCTDQGLAILTEEEPQDVYVCENGTNERAAKHHHIAAQVSAFFQGL